MINRKFSVEWTRVDDMFTQRVLFSKFRNKIFKEDTMTEARIFSTFCSANSYINFLYSLTDCYCKLSSLNLGYLFYYFIFCIQTKAR
jgi:hypothetical protein